MNLVQLFCLLHLCSSNWVPYFVSSSLIPSLLHFQFKRMSLPWKQIEYNLQRNGNFTGHFFLLQYFQSAKVCPCPYFRVSPFKLELVRYVYKIHSYLNIIHWFKNKFHNSLIDIRCHFGSLSSQPRLDDDGLKPRKWKVISLSRK